MFDSSGQRRGSTIPEPKVFVHLLPTLIPSASLGGGLAVVVDVLRATTVMVQALASGAKAIVPCGEIEDAKKAYAGFPEGSALLAGERGGLPIEGFDLGNAPSEFTREVCHDKTVVMTTTNGTRAVLASLDAERVYVASFGNLAATSREISVQFLKKDHGHSVHIVCAGTEGHVSLEDSLLAGALVNQIAEVWDFVREDSPIAARFGNDEALLAVTQWLEVEKLLRKRSLSKFFCLGRGGQNLLGIGRAADIEAAARVDEHWIVAELDREAMRIVSI
jgi:2-phosphosulfolactate phosphatase